MGVRPNTSDKNQQLLTIFKWIHFMKHPVHWLSLDYRVSQNYPNMQFFRDFRHCAKTADVVVSKIFRITHQESKLNVTLSPSQHIIPFSH